MRCFSCFTNRIGFQRRAREKLCTDPAHTNILLMQFPTNRFAKQNAKASTHSTTSRPLLWRHPPSMTWLRFAPSAMRRRSSRRGGPAFRSIASRTTSAPGTTTARTLALVAARATAPARSCTATPLVPVPARPMSPCRPGSKRRACDQARNRPR